MTYKVFSRKGEFYNDQQLIATITERLRVENKNSGMSWLNWLNELEEEGLESHSLDKFDFNLIKCEIDVNKVSYVLSCPDVCEDRYYYVGML